MRYINATCISSIITTNPALFIPNGCLVRPLFTRICITFGVRITNWLGLSSNGTYTVRREPIHRLPVFKVLGRRAVRVGKNKPFQFFVKNLEDEKTTVTEKPSYCESAFVYSWKEVNSNRWNEFSLSKQQGILATLGWAQNTVISSLNLSQPANLYSSPSSCTKYNMIASKLVSTANANGNPIVSDGASMFVQPSQTKEDKFYVFEVEAVDVNGNNYTVCERSLGLLCYKR